MNENHQVEDVPKGKSNRRWKLLAGVLGAGVVLLLVAWESVEYYTAQSSFCGGSCHTMDEQYAAWKTNTHHASNNPEGIQAGCVDCHFLPGEHSSLKAKYEGLRHLAAYLYDADAPLPIRPVVPDGACLQSGCHNEGDLAEQEIQFTEKIRFKHGIHLGEEALEGQKLTCDTCHMKVTEEKHFEVPNDICYLCHLRLEKPILASAKMAEVGSENILEITYADRPSVDFNLAASRCDICHVIPTEPLQQQLTEEDTLTKEVITHQTILKAGVACESCHFEVVKGAGEIVIGNVVSNGCFRCHNRSQTLVATAGDGTLMHDNHVATKKADCFDCHSTIEHKNRTDHLDFVRNDCKLCHADEHKYQKLLLSGTPINGNLSPTPHLMYEVNVNCMGCHLKKTVTNGHTVRTASGETCIACHTDRHGEMLDDWRSRIAEEVAAAEEIEQEALQIFEEMKSIASQEILLEVEKKLADGSELLNIVRVGNGVHNKKYAIMIIDEVFAYFEDSIDLLNEGE